MTRARAELFLASFLMLFVELVLIRWAGAYVVYLSYFANFVSANSFIGHAAKSYETGLIWCVVGAVMVAVGNFLADLMHVAADPRLRD